MGTKDTRRGQCHSPTVTGQGQRGAQACLCPSHAAIHRTEALSGGRGGQGAKGRQKGQASQEESGDEGMVGRMGPGSSPPAGYGQGAGPHSGSDSAAEPFSPSSCLPRGPAESLDIPLLSWPWHPPAALSDFEPKFLQDVSATFLSWWLQLPES